MQPLDFSIYFECIVLFITNVVYLIYFLQHMCCKTCLKSNEYFLLPQHNFIAPHIFIFGIYVLIFDHLKLNVDTILVMELMCFIFYYLLIIVTYNLTIVINKCSL